MPKGMGYGKKRKRRGAQSDALDRLRKIEQAAKG